MIDKIKAEIENVVDSGDGEYGCIDAYEKCLKWAEELEKEILKELPNNEKWYAICYNCDVSSLVHV